MRSQEIDPEKRLAIVWQIQRKLEEDAPRPMMGWWVDRFAHHPYVKNLVGAASIPSPLTLPSPHRGEG